MSDTQALEVDQFVPAPPAAVWRALTEPELLARWWAAGDIRPEVGHEFTLDMGGFTAQLQRWDKPLRPARARGRG